MPLGDPPGRALLRGLATARLVGRRLWRCHRKGRPMWWFATSSPGPRGGRFDLQPPNGSCYTAADLPTAVLESFQAHFGPGSVMPLTALRARSLSSVRVPAGAPPAADLTHRRSLAVGITAGLWSDSDRTRTKAWATELHGCGHQAILHGIQHDPTGRRRAITLFDRAGDLPPWGLDWPEPSIRTGDDDEVQRVLEAHGVRVARSRPALPVQD